MRKTVQLLALAGLLASLTGCGVTGSWKLSSVTPESMKDKVGMACMCLKDNGMFCAMVNYGGKEEKSCGKYTYEDRKLTFMPEQGEKREYHVTLADMGKTMNVHGEHNGEKWTAVMTKMDKKECKDACGKCCGKCGADCSEKSGCCKEGCTCERCKAGKKACAPGCKCAKCS